MRWIYSDWDGLDRDGFYGVAKLRQEVFVVEQQCAYADLDGLDPQAWHLRGWLGDELVAYLRTFAAGIVRPEQVIGRVIVAPAHRRRGIASVLMREAQQRLDPHMPTHLGAQAHLEGFYGSLGYRVCGPGYDEDGIPHLPMRREATRARQPLDPG